MGVGEWELCEGARSGRGFRGEAGAGEASLVEELVEGDDSRAGHAVNLALLQMLFN